MNHGKAELGALARRIASLFQVDSHQAREEAQGFLDLAYSWGKPPSGVELDRVLKRRLGKRLAWNSEAEKLGFEESEAARKEANKVFLRRK